MGTHSEWVEVWSGILAVVAELSVLVDVEAVKSRLQAVHLAGQQNALLWNFLNNVFQNREYYMNSLVGQRCNSNAQSSGLILVRF